MLDGVLPRVIFIKDMVIITMNKKTLCIFQEDL